MALDVTTRLMDGDVMSAALLSSTAYHLIFFFNCFSSISSFSCQFSTIVFEKKEDE